MAPVPAPEPRQQWVSPFAVKQTVIKDPGSPQLRISPMLAAARKSPDEEVPPPIPLVSVQPLLMVVSSTPAKVPTQNVVAKTQRPQKAPRAVG